MNLGELLEELRIRLDDMADPYLWSDPQLTRYINEAQTEAADRGRLILDTESPLTQFQTADGKAEYALSPLVLNVDAVYYDGLPLERAHEQDLDERSPLWRRDTGKPRCFIEREDGRNVRLYPKPNATGNVKMRLYRLPREPMEDEGDEPEIAERHHMRMLDWAAHLAYMRRDSDAEDQRRADQHEAMFIQSFGIRRDANVQRKQRPRRVPIVTHSW